MLSWGGWGGAEKNESVNKGCVLPVALSSGPGPRASATMMDPMMGERGREGWSRHGGYNLTQMEKKWIAGNPPQKKRKRKKTEIKREIIKRYLFFHFLLFTTAVFAEVR